MDKNFLVIFLQKDIIKVYCGKVTLFTRKVTKKLIHKVIHDCLQTSRKNYTELQTALISLGTGCTMLEN